MSQADVARHADLVVSGARVITMDSRLGSASAFAVSSGRFIAIGSDDDIAPFVGRTTRLLRLSGQAVLPGFIESHVHPLLYGLQRHGLDLSPSAVGNIGDVLDLVETRTAQVPAGTWVEGFGYDQTHLAEGRAPSRWELDRVSGDHPVCLWHVSRHIVVANSHALRLASITPDTPDTYDGMHGVIVKDPENGEPTGELRERGARNRLTRVMPKPDCDELVSALEWASREYAAAGITTMHDAGVGFVAGARDVQAYQRAAREERLSIRAVMMIREELLADLINDGKDLGLRTGFGDDRLRLGPVKITEDGSIQGLTGALTRGYECEPSNYGTLMYDQPEFTRRITRLHEAGFQIAVHANGDQAIDVVLTAYAEALRQEPRKNHRHRIEHCQMAREDQLDRMVELGVLPSFFVKHVYYFGDMHRDLFIGPTRAARISPLRSASQRGIRWGLHSDSPVTPPDPLFGLWCATTRTTSSGQTLGADQCVSTGAALRGYGTDAAYLAFAEDRVGSIEVNKLADFIVLDACPFDVDPADLADLRVLRTFVDGDEVYRRPELEPLN